MKGLHAETRAALAAWAPPDEHQRFLRDRYVALLDSRDDAMARTCLPDHITASTLVFDESHRWVLLTHHAKARRWFQFGGHPEAGDTTLAGAAQREALEESGLGPADLRLDVVPVELDCHAVPFCAPGHGVHHFDVLFTAVARRGVQHAVSDESLDVAWWPVDQLPDADLVPRVARARSRVRS